MSQPQEVFYLERPEFSMAAVCQNVVQGWPEDEASVLGDGLGKIPVVNRRPGLRRAGQHQRQTEGLKSSSAQCVALHGEI